MSNSLARLLGYGRDAAQGASNAAASTVSAPVDGIAWLLKRAGVDVGTPVGGSDWMAQQGLTAEPGNALAGGLGGFAAGMSPMGLAQRAPQAMRALPQMGPVGSREALKAGAAREADMARDAWAARPRAPRQFSAEELREIEFLRGLR
jgi:hypothetical protein